MGIGSFFRRIFRPIKKIIKKIIKAVIKPILNITEGFLGIFGMSFDAPEMPSPENFEATQQGILVNKQSNVANIPVVYGQRKVGGTRVFVGTAGDKNKYLYVCLAVCEGEIDSFTDLYINDEEQSLDSFATGGIRTIKKTTPANTTSSYFTNNSARAKFQFFTGSETQSASSLLKEHPKWTNNHTLSGVAYVACRFEWVKAEFNKDGDQTTFNPWSGIPSIQVVVKGRKVLPSEKYAASSGGGIVASDTNTATSTYASNLSSAEYSDNPADCLLDLLRNPRYGKGLLDNRISFADFKAAAQTCDIDKDFGGDLGTADFMTCNAVVSTSDNVLANTKKLMQSCRGFLPYTDGKYRLKIEANETTSGVQVITDDHIVSPIIIASMDKNGRYNQIRVTFANEKKDYESDTLIYQDATYRTEDGDEDLILNVSAPSITQWERAYYHGKYIVDRSRKGMTVSFTMTNEGQNIKPGDIVKLTHKYKREGEDSGGADEFMFNAKLFRALDVTLNYDSTVGISLIEHDNSADTVTAVQPTQSTGTSPGTPPNDGQGDQDENNKNGKVNAAVIINGSRVGISLTTQDTDGLANNLQIEMRLNGGGVVAQTLSNYTDGVALNFFHLNGVNFKPGDKIQYKVYTRRSLSNHNMSFVEGGTIYVSGTNSSSTFSKNYSQQGWT